MEVYRGLLENVAQPGLEGIEFHFLSAVLNSCANMYGLTRAIIFALFDCRDTIVCRWCFVLVRKKVRGKINEGV